MLNAMMESVHSILFQGGDKPIDVIGFWVPTDRKDRTRQILQEVNGQASNQADKEMS